MAHNQLSLGEHWEVFIKMKFQPSVVTALPVKWYADALRAMEERKSKLEALAPTYQKTPANKEWRVS